MKFTVATIAVGLSLVWAGVALATPPTADFTAGPSPVQVNEDVTFNATGSDPDGGSVSFSWDFGDGSPAATGDSVSHPYSTAGRKTVTMTATDSGSETRQVTHTVHVNSPPVPSFTYSPAAPSTNELVTFTTQSSDADGDPLSYAWELDGDDDFNDAQGSTATRSFPVAGKYRIKLRVSDGTTQEETFRDVVVGNRRPTATFVFSPHSPVAGDQVELTSTSSDPDGPIAGQWWDLNGDGDYHDAKGETASHVYSAGDHTVALVVCDQVGLCDIATRVLRVSAPPPRTLEVLSPFPVVRMSGRVFRRGTRIRRLSVRAPSQSTVSIRCKGRGCPYAATQALAPRGHSLSFRRMRRRLGPGALIEILVSRNDRIGKYTAFRIRRGRSPKRRDLCLPPGAKRGSVCPFD